MLKQKVLLIEDEEDIAALIKLQAELSGYSLHVETDGINGLKAVKRERPDLVVLDIMLPGLSGLDVCRQLKKDPDLKKIPIIIISAKSEELDVILGLELGADDYLTKPFSPKVLFSRVKAVMRRAEKEITKEKIIHFGPFILEADGYRLLKEGKPIKLTYSEFGILQRLLESSGKVLTRNQLLDNLSNDEAYVIDRNIDVHISSLRKKLGSEKTYIETVRGVGYRFVEEE